VRAVYRALGAAGGIAILSACTSGQSAVQPPSTAVDVQNTSTLQFRVGTGNFQGTTVLNTVVTFRQPNGLSATLFNTPTITGPAGFVVTGCPSASNLAAPVATTVPCTDNGTNHISGTPPTQPGVAMVVTTFNQTGGAFAYGFAPANSTTGGGANYSKMATSGTEIASIGVSNSYTQPVYNPSAAKLPFILGPPAVPDFHQPTSGFPAGFAGYDSGFVMFGVTPVVGTYAFNLTVPANTIGTFAAVFNTTATLASAVPLPAVPGPVSAGGLLPGPPPVDTPITFTVPAAPAGVTSRVLYVADRAGSNNTIGNQFFAYNVGAGATTITLSATSTPAIAIGDRLSAWVAGADFDIVGGAPPANTSTAPALPAQTDVTVSPLTGPITY
jgi:hypothetical protein